MKNLLGAVSEQLPNIICSEGGVMLKVIGYFDVICRNVKVTYKITNTVEVGRLHYAI